MCFDHNQCYVKLNLENAESFNDYNENKGTEDRKSDGIQRQGRSKKYANKATSNINV